MAANLLDSSATRTLVPLLSFFWGEGSVMRYARFTAPVTDGTHTWLSLPKMEVQIGKQHGGATDAPATILLPVGTSPFDKVCRVYPWPRVTVLIQECDPDNVTATIRKVFAGNLWRTTMNPNGKSGLVQAEIAGWKQQLSIPLSIPSTSTCPWTFGDQNCCKNLALLRQTGTITGIAGNLITVSGLTVTAWIFGTVKVDDLELGITFATGGTSFLLKESPPPEWLNAEAEFTPGCDQELFTCINTWDNEINFGGFGIKTPGYNPLIQSP